MNGSNYTWVNIFTFQVFYTVFYSPDKDVYTNELNTTESIANALIVSSSSSFVVFLQLLLCVVIDDLPLCIHTN